MTDADDLHDEITAIPGGVDGAEAARLLTLGLPRAVLLLHRQLLLLLLDVDA